MKNIKLIAFVVAVACGSLASVSAFQIFMEDPGGGGGSGGPSGGGTGNSVSCGSGNDFVFLNSSSCDDTASIFADEISGGAGDDDLFGNSGDDQISGSGGNDELGGGSGNDELDGGSGNDQLFGNSGNDQLDGGPGNDEIFGGTGFDEATGGGGSDRFIDVERANSFSATGEVDVIFLSESEANHTVFANAGDKIVGASAGDTVNIMIPMTELSSLGGTSLYGGPEDNNYIIFDSNSVDFAMDTLQQISGGNLSVGLESSLKSSMSDSGNALNLNNAPTSSTGLVDSKLQGLLTGNSGVAIQDYQGNNKIIFANMNSTDVSLKASNGQVAVYGANGAMLLSMGSKMMESVSSVQFSDTSMSMQQLTQDLLSQ
jgi:hypothetical protein